jgi:hypothetical protein
MAIKVSVRNKDFNGYRGGVYFKNGVGVFEDEAKGRSLAHSFGYEIVEEEKKDEDKKEAPKKASRKKAKKDEE